MAGAAGSPGSPSGSNSPSKEAAKERWQVAAGTEIMRRDSSLGSSRRDSSKRRQSTRNGLNKERPVLNVLPPSAEWLEKTTFCSCLDPFLRAERAKMDEEAKKGGSVSSRGGGKRVFSKK